MKYELVFSKKFRKKILKLDKKSQILILRKIKILGDNPSAGKCCRNDPDTRPPQEDLSKKILDEKILSENSSQK